MALGITVDFNANIGNIAGQVDRINSQLTRFQQTAETTSARVSRAFTNLGVGLSIAGFVAYFDSIIEAADALDELSDKTNVSVETLAGLSVVAKQSGTDVETLATSLNKFSINVSKSREAFASIGVSARDPYEAILQLADAYKSIQDPQKQAEFGARALGKAYDDWAPILKLGSDEIRRLVQEMSELSGVNSKNAKEAGVFKDEMVKLKTAFSGVTLALGGPVITNLSNLVSIFNDAGEAARFFANELSRLAGIKLPSFSFSFNPVTNLKNAIDNYKDNLNKLKNDKFAGPKLDLSNVNEEISKTQKKLTQLKDYKPTNIVSKFIDTRLEEVAQTKLNTLLEKRAIIATHLGEAMYAAKQKTDAIVKPPPTDESIDNFLKKGQKEPKTTGGGGGGRSSGGGGRGGGGGGTSPEQKAMDQLQSSYNSMLESLNKEIVLRDKNSETAKIEYELINGSLRGLAPAQANNLLALAKEKDALEIQQKKWDALIESANAYYDVRQSNSDLIKYGGIQEGFNDALAKTQDALKAGDMTVEQAAAEYTKLGKAYNDEYIAPAKAGTDELSQYAIQGARNMQSAFANFLFDPFNESLGSLVDNFASAIRRMAAEYVSSQIFDALKTGLNGLSKPSTSSTAASAASSINWGAIMSGIASLFGNSQAQSDAAFLASAKGNVFQNSNIIPFARGDVFNQPTTFPMKGNKIGLLGESGPEAIMPLSRGADGKLGIRSNSLKGNNFNVIVNVNGNNNAPDVRRAAGQGAREALGLINGASRYG